MMKYINSENLTLPSAIGDLGKSCISNGDFIQKSKVSAPCCPEKVVIRSEEKRDIFYSDLSGVVTQIEERLPEIARRHESTATIHFHDQFMGAPAVDFGTRLRSYCDLAPLGPDPDKLACLDWRIERKNRKRKTFEGILGSLGDARSIGPGRLVVNNRALTANTLKIAARRHFALQGQDDERLRLTVDVNRALHKFENAGLVFLGEMGPRIEVKTPQPMALPDFLTETQEQLHEALPFGSLLLYFQHLLRSRICKDSFSHLGELELKFTVAHGRARDLLLPVLSWLGAQPTTFQLLLPYPQYMSRMRRYHVCEGGDRDAAATIVETPAGRCSIKSKKNARREGAVLIRETVASHNTDIEGKKMSPTAFAQGHDLRLVNSFVKVQHKVPFCLRNGLAFQLTLDECKDRSNRSLHQLELEFIGEVTGRQPDLTAVLSAMTDLSTGLSNAPFAHMLKPTRLSKHHYFIETA
ncbi:hypothetical protein IWQ55_004081 [Labrenzia sp. EL_208]|nr:hypothetical protein [Labrenzia sp. EL_132]MBG6230857.1 hypothetical protein [Labrenzia sp. EL_208]